MSFSDHKITQFTHKITDLPDQPNLPANELKARFDSSPEELRQAVNGICDDASRLEARVEGIVVDTFGDTIDREMLSDELAAELDAKADETSVAARFAAEQAARQTSDSALDARLTAAEAALPEKCEVYCGLYDPGDSSVQDTVYLGFQPKAVLMVSNSPTSDYTIPLQLALPNTPHQLLTITKSGFTVDYHQWRNNSSSAPFRYFAFK